MNNAEVIEGVEEALFVAIIEIIELAQDAMLVGNLQMLLDVLLRGQQLC